MKATVVIPTYKRSDRLRALLECLTVQEGDALAQVVVCDDGSPDDTREVALSFRTRLPLEYQHQEDRGFRAGQARNMGVRTAIGDVLIFVDDDVLLARDFVKNHVEAHRTTPAGQQHLVIGYRHRSFDFQGKHPEPHEISSGENDDRVAVLGPDGHGVHEHETPWVFVYSCNFSAPKAAKELLFDEGFSGWGMEDIELGYRLWRSGLKIVPAPKARVLHIEDPAPRDPFRCEERALPPKYDSYIRNAVYFMDKYPDDQALRDFLRKDLRWYVRDEVNNCWTKNGYANDPDAVVEFCRRERLRAQAPAAREPRGHKDERADLQ